MKLGSMGVAGLTALAVACLANAAPAEATSIDGTLVGGLFGFNTGFSPNYFDPATSGFVPPAIPVENTSTDALFSTFYGPSIVTVPNSDTAVEFGGCI